MAFAEWPIKNFEVVAVEPAGVVEGDLVFHRWVEEMVRIMRTETNFDPDFPAIWDESTVSLPGLESATLELESALSQAADALESWGFPTPALNPVVQSAEGVSAYRIYLVTGRAGAAGIYHQRTCDFGVREAIIVLDADDVLNRDGFLTVFGTSAAIHELVHAVQQSFAPQPCVGGFTSQWIREGTAEAIAWDITRRIHGFTVPGRLWRRAWGARLYSEPLAVPGATGNLRAYLSSSFWRWLAEHETAQPSFPGPDTSWPGDYSYLRNVIGRPIATSDCYNAGGSCDAELRWLDAGLRDHFGLSLRDLYARFMQVYAQYGQERLSSTTTFSSETARKNWLGSSFRGADEAGCREVTLGPLEQQRQKRIVVPRFNDVASQCWEVSLEDFTGPVRLGVTATYRPGSEAVLQQLTAIMADDSQRIDRAEVRTVAGTPEATWHYDHLAEGGTTTFLLANVADQPDATRGLTNLEVTFTALREYVRMSLSGEASTDGGPQDGGPTPAEIAATPLAFEAAEGDFTVFYQPPACLVQIRLRSQQEDSLVITGRLTPPITARTYPLDRSGSGGLDTLGAQLWGSPEFAEVYGRFFAENGSLTIEHVDPLMVTGRVEAFLERGVTRGRRSAQVHAEFSLQPGSSVSGILGAKKRDHPCFTERPASPPSGASGSSNGTSGSSESPVSRESGQPSEATPSEGTSSTEGTAEPTGAAREDPPGRLVNPGQEQGTGTNEAVPGAPSDPGEDAAPASPDAGGQQTESGLMLTFSDSAGGSLRSSAQSVTGSSSPERLDISAETFDLQFGIPSEWLLNCGGPNFQPAGIMQLIAINFAEASPLEEEGRYPIEVNDSQLELKVDAGGAELELNYSACRANRCQPATIRLHGGASRGLIPAGGQGAYRVAIEGASLETLAAGHAGRCDGLIDWSFTLEPVS